MIQCQNKSDPWVVLQINKSVFSHSSFKFYMQRRAQESNQGGWSSRKAWLKITIFAIPFPFLLASFLGGKRKGEKKNQSRDFKSCLSAKYGPYKIWNSYVMSQDWFYTWKYFWPVLQFIKKNNLLLMKTPGHSVYLKGFKQKSTSRNTPGVLMSFCYFLSDCWVYFCQFVGCISYFKAQLDKRTTVIFLPVVLLPVSRKYYLGSEGVSPIEKGS